MADLGDQAADYQERLNAEALRLRTRQSSGRPAQPDGPRPCMECGEDIPSARLAAQPGAERCIDCQQDFER